MRRLNVQFSQIEECISTALFAVDALPRNPPLERGEVLLLQLVKDDAERLGRLDRRVEFALIFDRAVPDPNGDRSRQHWPKAGKTWRYILECSATLPTVPFSLERLPLGQNYGSVGQAVRISDEDEAIIRPYLKGETKPQALPDFAGVHQLLSTIWNYDTVVRLAPVRTTRVREHERRYRDPWLSDTLKAYYDHRCQICLHDFVPRYGVPFADTRFLLDPLKGGDLTSRNTVVVCPNHNAIIGEARAEFDRAAMTYVFPNGLREKLTLRDHLLGPSGGDG